MAEQPVHQDNVTPLQPTPVRRRGIGVRAVVVSALTVLAVGYATYWVYDRLSHVHMVDARISSTMIQT